MQQAAEGHTADLGSVALRCAVHISVERIQLPTSHKNSTVLLFTCMPEDRLRQHSRPLPLSLNKAAIAWQIVLMQPRRCTLKPPSASDGADGAEDSPEQLRGAAT